MLGTYHLKNGEEMLLVLGQQVLKIKKVNAWKISITKAEGKGLSAREMQDGRVIVNLK